MPMGPLMVPTEAEMSLVLAAKYETDFHLSTATARRGFHTLGALIAVAAVVFGYDFFSLATRH